MKAQPGPASERSLLPLRSGRSARARLPLVGIGHEFGLVVSAEGRH